MTRTADGHRGRTRTSAGADPEVADLQDESAYSGRCGVSVNRYRTAASAEFRRRLLSGDVFQDLLNDVRTGHISDHAQPTAAVRADRQIDREHSAQSLHPRHRRSRGSRVGLTISTQRRHPSVSSRAATQRVADNRSLRTCSLAGADELESIPGTARAASGSEDPLVLLALEHGARGVGRERVRPRGAQIDAARRAVSVGGSRTRAAQ